MKKNILIAVVVMFLLAGCMPGPNTSEDVANAGTTLAGFWFGLWHGVISPVTFVISLFSNKVNLYEIHNNGGFYNLGFILGIMITFGGSGKATSRGK